MKKIIYSLLVLAMTAMTFTSCEDVPMPYEYPNNEEQPQVTPEVDPTGDGTEANPYNVSAALKVVSALAADAQTEPIYVKGKISKIVNVETEKYGNANYYISEDGSTNGKQLYIFQSLYLAKAKFTSADQIHVGDEVVIYGPFTNYKGNTPETVGKGSSYIYSLNGKQGEVQPAPSGEAITVAEAIEKIKAGSTEEAIVKGIVVKTTFFNEKFGSLTYYISDDGQDANTIQVYGGLGLEKAKFASKDDLKPGDKVTVQGKLKLYKKEGKPDVYEIDLNSFLLKLEKGEGGNTGETGNGGENNGGTTGGAGNIGKVEGNTITLTATDMGFADKAEATTCTLSDGTVITFATGQGTTPPKFYGGEFQAIRLYAKNTFTIKATKKIVKIEIECAKPYTKDGKTTYYNGNATCFAQSGDNKIVIKQDSETQVTFAGLDNSTITIVNEHSEAKGGTQLRIAKLVITYAN